ncbi:MAG TPA: condensation domain-containing protein, partial [Pyrinomonadaceae bacterium]|nr:condensation domain-containing protein [Pyrinomonadaceae bacterium]
MDSKKVAAVFPVSPCQEALLLANADSLEQECCQISCRLVGDLNLDLFENAWQQVISRHEILRTSFAWKRVSKPLQAVWHEVALPIQQEDWRSVSSQEQEQRLDHLLKAERQRGIDPAQAPLMRLSLLRLGDDSYQLVWSHHHLLLDDWCVSVIFKEVLSYYDAFREGESLELPAARSYREYIAWLQRQDQQEAEQYWREQLRGFTESTQLGIERSGRSHSKPAVEWAR